ncbi:cysteine desulfurase-like protein [Nannocystis sp.]|uniref:cysteine desulfurase-like protein n=1 Tax=Nannocystis sp. TaxID=1962667 RepID=UPI0025CC0699|nr:cysteine desulfurase-like protein [Nannocystis sp.]MBK7827556.1 cysteine desulfurase-like protein [Nannocystis sp.]
MQRSLDRIRARFPGLAGDELLLDNAGGSQILGSVIDEIADYLRSCNVQHGASYARSRVAVERVLAGERALASLLGDGPGPVIIGSSTTQLVFNLAAALAPSLRPGDEIVVSEADHEANVGAWARLAGQGVVVRSWPIERERLRLEPAGLAPLLSARTRLVCMTHCSNVVGTIHDVAAVADMVHSVGARLFVDGVAYAPHRGVDAAALGADGYVFSVYKVYGPHLAAAYLSPGFFAELANINHHFLADAGAYRLEPGGVCYELVAGCAAIPRYLDELGEALDGPAEVGPRARAWAAIAAHEEALSARLLEFLAACPRVRVVGETCPDRQVRVPTISFVVAGMRSSELPPRLAAQGIGVRFGDFYARALIDRLGLRAQDGVVRVSLVHYNRADEVDRLIAALAPIVG